MVTGSTLVAIAIDGIAFGVVLALLGVSITLVFGLGEVLNLAVGIFSVLAVLIATVVIGAGGGLLIGVLVGIVVVALLGLAIDQTVFRSVYRSEGEERILLGIFVTLGLAVFFQGVLVNVFSSRYSLSIGLSQVTVGPVSLTGSSVAIILAGGVVLAAVFALLRYTFAGKATRTLFQDERGARLVGVNARRIRTLIFVSSAVVAALGGIVFAWGSTVTVASGFELTTYALIVSIVGGVRSVGGAVTAGILLGLVSGFANFYIGSYLATVILFGTAVVVILAKPEVLS